MNKKFKQDITALQNMDNEKLKFVMRNYSIFFGKNIRHVDEMRIASDKSIRISNVDIHSIFEINEKVIGKGQFGKVRIAKQKNFPSRIFAIKTVQKQKAKNFLHSVYNEVLLLSECDHPNIAKFYETFDSSNIVHFQLEYCSGGDLLKNIIESGGIAESRCKVLFRQILLAINHMHLRGICHRDVKPENFIFGFNGSNSMLKLVDFGFAKRFFGNNGKSRLFSLVGTPAYVAPEVLTGDYDEKCDIWSAGITLYQMACGKLPFALDVQSKDLFKQVIRADIDFETPFENLNLSNDFFDLLTKLLMRNEKGRISVSQALAHPWFRDINKRQIEMFQIKEFMNNFNEFKNYNSFQKNVLKNYVKGLSEREIDPLKTLFEMIDRDLDGIISFPELKYFLIQHGLFISNDNCLENIGFLHKTDNHHIFYTEFLASVIDKNFILKEITLQKIFDSLQMTQSTLLTMNSIENIYILSGYTFDKSKFLHLLDLCGVSIRDKAGLNFKEFKVLMMNDLESMTTDGDEINNLRIEDSHEKQMNSRKESFLSGYD